MLLFLIPLFAIAMIILPLIVVLKRKADGKPVKAKKAILTNVCSFIGVMVLMSIFIPLFAFAAEESEAISGAAITALGVGEGLKYIAAALSTGLATVGTGLAVGKAAPAAIGATAEDDKNFAKALIFVALGEGVAIYGLLISILILFS